MCVFITLAVPARHAALVKQMAGRDFSIRPQLNETIAKHVGDRATFVMTVGGCSCDLYASESNARAVAVAKERDAAQRKYAKLGWSAAKIERALAARHTSADRAREFTGLRQDARDLIAGIAEAVGEVGLLVHDYAGKIDEETVIGRQGGVATPDDLRAGTTSIVEDVVVWIVLSA